MAVCPPLRGRDLLAPFRLLTTFQNWSAKGPLLPARQAAKLATVPVTLLVLAAFRLSGVRFRL